ncbi:MAG TPA: hypothetical protein PKX93_01415 [bacterium]|nr:hypothetical protein [bacterium]HOL66102.1 hypothetical protein [bacterium]HPP11177.1 hypothetical protein [bacterium]
MSYTSILLVKEFFSLHGFLALPYEDILLVKNSNPGKGGTRSYLMEIEDVLRIEQAVVKPVAWHTLKFVPSVLKQSPEIFRFLEGDFLSLTKKVFSAEGFSRVLVIPGLPASSELKEQSITYLKEKGIDGVICFPTVLAALIKKINPRRVYLSQTNELLRILKFYEFFKEEQPSLPFRGK